MIPSVVCVVIWFAVGFGSFFWPAFVMLATGINVLRMLMNRNGYIEEERHKLERKQRKALEAPQAPHDEDD